MQCSAIYTLSPRPRFDKAIRLSLLSSAELYYTVNVDFLYSTKDVLYSTEDVLYSTEDVLSSTLL